MIDFSNTENCLIWQDEEDFDMAEEEEAEQADATDAADAGDTEAPEVRKISLRLNFTFKT